jgi:3-deoxy-D-manno-octulosonate 8-phosphate phosphatase (KDO 8-P phosphatase)
VNKELSFSVAAEVLKAAAAIKLVLFDVDGVLTDGSLFMSDDGQEYKAFYSRDGHGLKMLQHSGVEVGIITGRTSKVVEHRAAELGIKHLFQGSREKLATYLDLVEKFNLNPQEIAFVGDDVVDLPIMLQTGLAVAVQDAHHLIKQHADWVTPSRGGRGAARELCEMIMYAQGTYLTEINRFYVAPKGSVGV